MTDEIPRKAPLPEASFGWRIIQPLFSVYVWLAGLVVLVTTAVVAMLLLPVISFQRSHPYIGAPGMALCVRLTFSKLKIDYDPLFNPNRRAVFCQNHINVLDGHLACAVVPHAFCGLMEASHFKLPGYGWIMKLAGGIPVYKKASGRTAEITAAARERIERGLSILVFPEAHRTRTGYVAPYKKGVFFMARDAGIPVVPLCVRGMYQVNRKGTWLFTPGTIEVWVGPQVETAGMSDEEIDNLAQKFHEITARFNEFGERTDVRSLFPGRV